MTEDATLGEHTVGSPEFSIAISDHGPDYCGVVVIGDVDLSTAPQLSKAMRQAQDRTPHVLLDLRGVEFLGSVGLSVLVDSARRAADAAGRLAVLVTSRTVLRAIEITGLDAVLRIFDDEADARAFLVG